MKARFENGFIKIYGALPSKYKSATLNVAGGFHKMPDEQHETEGFFNVIEPAYDQETQDLGEITWDAENSNFTYPVVEIEIDLEVERENRKAELKQAVEDELMAALGVGALEHLILDGTVPQSYKDTVINLRAWEAQTYAQIDGFSDKKEMKRFRIKREDVENAKTVLKAGRKNH